MVVFILFLPFQIIGGLLSNLRSPQLPQLSELPGFPKEPFLTDIETSYENEEVWSWVDWKGREREITVSRKAKVR